MLIGIHTGIAALTKNPIFQIDEDEAKKLAKATARVMSLYEVKVNPHAEAWGLLIVAGAQVYGPRLAAAALMARARRSAPAPEADQTIPDQFVYQPN